MEEQEQFDAQYREYVERCQSQHSSAVSFEMWFKQQWRDY
jgi:hypothetical protein